MDLNKIIKEDFINDLLANLNNIGIPIYNVECILVEGSALYLTNANDIDLKVMLKRYNNKAEMMKSFSISNYKVDCTYYTFNDWSRVLEYKKDAQYIVESPDMVCIYGNDEKFLRFDPVNDKAIQKFVIEIYDKYFFNYKKENKQTYKMDDKRLWNFLLFAFKLENKSNNLTSAQLSILQNAHDLKINKEEYRPLFDKLKENLVDGR